MSNTPAPMSLRETLNKRASLLGVLRDFFERRGFLEVSPPCLLPESIVDAYIDPIRVSSRRIGVSASAQSPDDPQTHGDWFLQTSPELAMKRLLSAGAGSIYTITPVFRGHEWGAQHRPEFSMLEWYEVGADAKQGMETLGHLAMQLFGQQAYETKTYREVFQTILEIDPIDCEIEELTTLIGETDGELAVQLTDDRDDLLDILLSQRIQPFLGIDRPLVLCDYPISQAALAKPSADDPNCAARFELFYRGFELANGYDELLDPHVLRERVSATNQKRQRAGKAALPPPESLLQAMNQGLPQSAGVAMGVDRVLMLICETKNIGDVMPGRDQQPIDTHRSKIE